MTATSGSLRYDDAGVFLRAELLDDPRAVLDHLRWRDAALAQAIPVNDYLGITRPACILT